MIWKILKRIFIGTASFFLLLTLALLVFRGKIERYAISQLDPYFKIPVYIHDVDFTFWRTFPNFSIRLEGVYIKDNSKTSNLGSDTLLYAKTIDLKANTWKLMKSDFSIESIIVKEARLGLVIDKKGKENFDIFVQSSDSVEQTEDFEINLKKVRFEDVKFTFDHFKNKQQFAAHFDELELAGAFSEEQSNLELQGDFDILKFQDQSINLLRKAHINLETSVNVDNKRRAYEVKESNASINGIAVKLNYFQDSVKMNLHVEAQNVPLEQIMRTFHKADLEKLKEMDVKGLANFDLKMSDASKFENAPDLEVVFGLKNGSLRHQSVATRIDELSFQGKLTKKHNHEEILKLEHCKVRTMGQRLEGRFVMENFSNPRIDTKARGQIDLAAFHFFFPLPNIQEISGAVYVDSDFSADILNMGTPRQQVLLRYSKSDLDCKNVKLQLEGAVPLLERISGKVTMKNDDFVFRDFQVKTQQSDFEVNGDINNVIGYLEQTQNLEVKASLKSNRIVINEFVSSNKTGSTSSTGVGEFLLPKIIIGSMLCSIGTLQVDQHEFKKLQADVLLQNRRIHLKQMILEHLGSSIKGAVMLSENRASWIEIEGRAETNEVNLPALFKEWNNFEQETIKSENIQGKADARMDFYLPFNVNTGLNKDRMRAEVVLKVRNGALNQVESLKEIARSMQSYGPARVVLGKNLPQIEQKLAKLTFETLENRFTIENAKFIIPKMLIKTNLMEIAVSGWQHFDESLEYRFEFDFKDLKIQKRDSEFGEVVDDGVSSRLFLRMYGTLSNVKFSWDSEAKKAYRKDQNKQEKADVKSMLKSEFGLFKKDSTVGIYQKEERVREKISLDFGEDTLKTEEELKNRNKGINTKFKKIREANKPKEEKLLIEIDN